MLMCHLGESLYNEYWHCRHQLWDTAARVPLTCNNRLFPVHFRATQSL